MRRHVSETVRVVMEINAEGKIGIRIDGIKSDNNMKLTGVNERKVGDQYL